MDKFEYQSQPSSERESYLPLITAEEQRFIENVGGEYAGYIQSNTDGRHFEQFRVDRRAHYDEERREIVETYIATETIDEDGEKELQSPEAAAGFSIMIEQLAQSGEELASPTIVMVRLTDFKRVAMTVSAMQILAQSVHTFAVDRATSLNQKGLSAAVKDYLLSSGWIEKQ
jgi:hypothetical protein